jgi:hypothetical protein
VARKLELLKRSWKGKIFISGVIVLFVIGWGGGVFEKVMDARKDVKFGLDDGLRTGRS